VILQLREVLPQRRAQDLAELAILRISTKGRGPRSQHHSRQLRSFFALRSSRLKLARYSEADLTEPGFPEFLVLSDVTLAISTVPTLVEQNQLFAEMVQVGLVVC
jgi:hypothetical protein